MRLTRKSGGVALESADGTRVYFAAGSGSLLQVPANGGEEIEIAPRVFGPHSFAVARNGVYFMPDPRTLQFWDERSHHVVTVARLDRNSADDGMSVSQDGAYMVFAQKGHLSSDVMLVENFQ